jgi:hypothetical protein
VTDEEEVEHAYREEGIPQNEHAVVQLRGRHRAVLAGPAGSGRRAIPRVDGHTDLTEKYVLKMIARSRARTSPASDAGCRHTRTLRMRPPRRRNRRRTTGMSWTRRPQRRRSAWPQQVVVTGLHKCPDDRHLCTRAEWRSATRQQRR